MSRMTSQLQRTCQGQGRGGSSRHEGQNAGAQSALPPPNNNRDKCKVPSPGKLWQCPFLMCLQLLTEMQGLCTLALHMNGPPIEMRRHVWALQQAHTHTHNPMLCKTRKVSTEILCFLANNTPFLHHPLPQSAWISRALLAKTSQAITQQP